MSSSEAVANVAALLQALKDKNLVLESGSDLKQRMVLVEKEKEPEEEEEEEVIEHEKEVVVVEEAAAASATRVEKRSTLRKGSEGEEVREMQVRVFAISFFSAFFCAGIFVFLVLFIYLWRYDRRHC